MCEQCSTDAVSYGEPLPGWYLMRAQRDGMTWKAQEWGLVECNDPTFVWSATPTPDPVWGMTDEEEEAWFNSRLEGDPELKRASLVGLSELDFFTAFRSCRPNTGYRLIVAAMARGYDPETSGDFCHWFFAYLGEWLKTHGPENFKDDE